MRARGATPSGIGAGGSRWGPTVPAGSDRSFRETQLGVQDPSHEEERPDGPQAPADPSDATDAVFRPFTSSSDST